MEQLVTEIEYAVGLSREEYVRSQAVVANVVRGKHMVMQRIVSLVLMVLCIGAVAVEYRLSGAIDVGMIVLVGLILVAEVWMMLDLPRQIRQNHEAAYDTTLFSGHSFEGMLTVDEHGLTKRTADETIRLNFAQCDAFIETEDMLLFCVTRGKSIIVPARYLTAEDAAFTKKVAGEAIPPVRRYTIAPIVPQLAERLYAPVVAQPEEPSLVVAVEYTASELKAQLTDTVIRGFFNKFPNKMLTAVLLTIVLYFGMEIPPLPLFLAALVLLFLVEIVGVQLRIRRAIAASDGDICRLKVNFTEQALQLVGRGEAARKLRVPWERITRAVERPREVEFFVDSARVVTIPKRCISNMEELRSFVDTHVTP
ncbi:MAG: YcxB family protein [Clostridia bacterium]|nr:YcxB family protein [Clostridia bacterium]